ncbi:MAG: diguanylate cyclase [Eubacteriales bacterium]|nr:diguanylate cyclase [Eubacteriales bacterium]
MDTNNYPIQTVMECLSDDYEFLGLVDLKKNEIQGFRFTGAFKTWVSLCNISLPGKRFDVLLHTLIPKEDLSAFIQSVDRDTLMVHIGNGDKITIPCRLSCSGIKHYAIEFAPNPNDTNLVAIAIRNVEDVVKSRIELEKKLESKMREQTDVIQASVRKITDMQSNVIEAMATLVESRDVNTGNHVQNTRKYVSLLIDKLRDTGAFPELNDADYSRNIILASVLHDIGKIFVSDMILNKPGKLTTDEFEIIRSHTTLGKEIVDKVFSKTIDADLISVIRDIVYGHHEKWNGKGYPQGLSGDDIPVAARIMAVADVLDALVSRRSYKDPYSLEEALEIIRKDSGSHFDSRIVDALFSVRAEIEEYLTNLTPEDELTVLSGAYNSFSASVQDKSIVSAFVADYVAAGLCNPFTGKLRSVYYKGQSYDYRSTKEYSGSISAIRQMFGDTLHPDDEKAVTYAISPEGMKAILKDKPEYTYNYRYLENGEYKHRQICLIRISSESSSESFDVLLGVRDIEEEVVLSNTNEQCITALMNEENIDDAIKIILKSVTDFYKGDRAYIYYFDDITQTAVLQQEYTTSPELKKIGITNPIPLQVLQNRISYMETNGIFISNSTENDLDEAEKAAFSARRPESLFLSPIMEHGKVNGFWGIDNPSVRMNELSLLENMVFTVSEAADKARAQDQIRKENELIRALITDYGAIYRVNLLTREVNIFGLDKLAQQRYAPIFRNPNFNLDDFIDKYYITPDVVEEDQDRLRKAIAVNNCRRELKDKKEFSVIFRVRRDGVNSVYTEVKVFKAEEIDGEVAAVILAFKVVDAEIRHELERVQALHMISYDGLTGLLNRATFMKKVNEYLTTSGSTGCAMIMIDLDNFKQVNDSYGHQEGDKILINIAGEIKNSFCDGEIISRFGGDEFAIFIPNANRTSLYVKLMAFQDSMNRFFEARYQFTKITASIGSVLSNFNGTDVDALIAASNKEMYEAKSSGRNRMNLSEL